MCQKLQLSIKQYAKSAGEGDWLVKYTNGVGTVTQSLKTDGDCETSMTLNKDTLNAILTGQMTINAAYLQGWQTFDYNNE